MATVDRLIVLATSILLFAGTTVFLVSMARHDVLEWMLRSVEQAALQFSPPAIAVAILLFVLGFMLLRLGAGPRRGNRAIVRETSLGEVRISLVAIENLVRRVARQVRGVKEVDTLVEIGDDGIRASLSIMVAPDINIPEICDELQARVEQYVRDTVGVDTLKTRINVRNISGTEQRSRVE
ncbi:MAG TPA: alkaline shock response membrane anchor protein AmaP [Firmicutes bacterium]|nr:alkaline shock response membrane anchor protein AmaP [Bacillota bacterium]